VAVSFKGGDLTEGVDKGSNLQLTSMY